MARSIRWTLLGWYAAILAAVLGGFGVALYFQLERSMLAAVDAELAVYVQTVGAEVEEDPPGHLGIDLHEEYAQYFRPGAPGAPYFVIWNTNGGIVMQSPGAPDTPRPVGTGARAAGPRRESTGPGRESTVVVVGRSIEAERRQLAGFLSRAVPAGAGVLVVALVGGWLLSSRVLAPIRAMTGTAAAISASDLSWRIDVDRTAPELAELGRTLNAAFDRLQAAFERQTRFTADASHELRTPLSILLTQTELALRKDRTPSEYVEALQASLRAAQRMRSVVEGLLTLARADAGEANLRRERLDLAPLVTETVELLRPMTVPRAIALSCSAAPAVVQGDAERIRDVVTNLVGNAIRYNRDGGRVEVGLAVDGGEAVLSVADAGPGIPAADQPHLFERFYRVDKARSREQGGSGLGLAIARWTVEAHGGRITFTSREGEGTAFEVRLPLATPAGSGERSLDSAHRASLGTSER